MVGFIDIEANTDSSSKYKRTVYDIIELSIVSEDLSIIHGALVKPTHNNGVLFDRIIKLTGITQTQVNNALTLDDVIQSMFHTFVRFNVIYSWGSFDKELLIKNRKALKGRSRKQINFLINHVTDLQREVQKLFELKNSLSLPNAAKLYNVSCNDIEHRADLDCEMLRKVYVNFKQGTIDKELLSNYKSLDSRLKVYEKIEFKDGRFQIIGRC